MNNGLVSPENGSLEQTLEGTIQKIGVNKYWQGIKNSPLLDQYMRFDLPDVQRAGFNSHMDFYRETIDQDLSIELGAELLGWAVFTGHFGSKLAHDVLPERHKGNVDLTTLLQTKIETRAWEMLERFNDVISLGSRNQFDGNQYDFFRRGVRSHKAVIASYLLMNKEGKTFPSNLALPFGFWKEIRQRGLFTKENQPFSDSIWELWELLELQKDLKKPENIASEIAEFSDANAKVHKERSAYTDVNQEKQRIKMYLDYFIKAGLFPKDITLTDLGIGFGELADYRRALLEGKGYKVQVNGVDVSEKIAEHFRNHPEMRVNLIKMLFSQAPFETKLLGSSQLVTSDWGTPQQAYTMSERIATDQALNLLLADNGIATLNLTLDEADMGNMLNLADINAILRGDVHHMSGNAILTYPANKEKTTIFVEPREFVMKSMRDAGLEVINMDEENILATRGDFPPPSYPVGRRIRLDVIAIKRKPLFESKNIVSSLQALGRFGQLAFPQMIKDESKNT